MNDTTAHNSQTYVTSRSTGDLLTMRNSYMVAIAESAERDANTLRIYLDMILTELKKRGES